MKAVVLSLLLWAAALHGQSTAYFSGGCFWCTESDMEKVPGVRSAESGYLGGKEVRPSYKDVSSGKTTHREGVKVLFDESQVSYEDLLEVYIRKIDPTDATGSFVDRGFQYSAAIFYVDENQRKSAAELLEKVAQLPAFRGKKLAVALLPLSTFYPAEDYHQDYYKKNAVHYNFYRFNSGRDQATDALWKKVPSFFKGDVGQTAQNSGNNIRLASTRSTVQLVQNTENRIKEIRMKFANFKKPSESELKSKLSDLSFRVTQKDATERAFTPGNFNDEKRRGIYVDIVSGEPLFSSANKYDSGTGWPSFDRPIHDELIVEKPDISIWGVRTEVRSKYGDSHLGHVFKDGPRQTTGLRYCINGAALRFVPFEDLDAEGYGQYKDMFSTPPKV